MIFVCYLLLYTQWEWGGTQHVVAVGMVFHGRTQTY